MAAATVNAAEVMQDLSRWIDPALRDVTEYDLPRLIGIPFGQVFTVPATSVDDNDDILRLFKCPAGAYIREWRSSPSDLDSGANLVYSILAINDADATQVTLVSGSNKGQAGTASDRLLDDAVGKYVGNYWIALKATTGAAGGAAAGTLKCYWELSIGIVNRNKRGTYLANFEA
jgi:hypothetical protein